jgi:hypothetical protein
LIAAFPSRCFVPATANDSIDAHWTPQVIITDRLAVEGLGVIRVEPDGLVEVLNGAVELALATVSIAPVREVFR